MKRYAIGLYAHEVTKQQALEAAKAVKSRHGDFENLIFDICFEDPEPAIKWDFETKEKAGMAMNNFLELKDYGDYLRVSCVLLQKYTADEDGDFIEGSDFDSQFKVTQKDIDTFNRFVGKEIF